MSVVDILVTIIVVTILVTIVLAIVTYIAYKLRLARRPVPNEAADGPRYFDLHEAGEPAAARAARPSTDGATELERIRPRPAPAAEPAAPPAPLPTGGGSAPTEENGAEVPAPAGGRSEAG